MHDAYDTTQHTVHNFLIELPQPSSANKEGARPDSCIVYAHADGWFYNHNAEGRPRIMCRRNGGKYRLEVVRLKEKEEQGENPWRISKQRVELSWQDMGTWNIVELVVKDRPPLQSIREHGSKDEPRSQSIKSTSQHQKTTQIENMRFAIVLSSFSPTLAIAEPVMFEKRDKSEYCCYEGGTY
ncbi:hypothetical protein KCV07_g238, partial [Aureobasidium melanogenum]